MLCKIYGGNLITLEQRPKEQNSKIIPQKEIQKKKGNGGEVKWHLIN